MKKSLMIFGVGMALVLSSVPAAACGDEDVKKSFDARCNAHLGKPIERRIHLETIANLTARRTLPWRPTSSVWFLSSWKI